MTRWLHPPARQSPSASRRLDPRVEGAGYRLPPELLRALWDQACADTTDGAGESDEADARARFHQLAARLVARGGQRRPDVGAVTRVGMDAGEAWDPRERSPSTPGRETRVMAEARRWARSLGESAAPGATSRRPAPHRPTAAEHTPTAADAQPYREPPALLAGDRLRALFGHGRAPSEPPPAIPVSSPADPEPRHRSSFPHLLGGVRGEGPTPPPSPPIFRSDVAPADPDAAADPALAEALRQRGGGEPLSETLRSEMEGMLGADLGQVRLHTHAIAGQAAQALRARAFTTGVDIFFALGAFDPHSTAGRALVAHELTHVVQAQQGRVPHAPAGQVHISEPGEALEQEAERVARCFRVPTTVPRGPRDSRQAPAAVAAPRRLSPPGVSARGNSRPGVAEPPAALSAWSTPARALQPGNALLRAPDPATADGPVYVPASSTPIDEIGIVAWDGQPALHLRSTPSTADSNLVASLPFNTRVQVVQRLPGDWLLIATLDGKTGFCARPYVWYAPEHRLPEPNARLHKVEPGEQGDAIHVARRYYGEVADHWGSDLRFYVRVLGAVNHIEVPDTTSGWKTVRFPAGTYLWIPSIPFARSLHGALSSGSPSYELASALGAAGILHRAGELLGDLKDAIWLSRQYIPAAVARHVEDSAVSILESLLQAAAGAVALLAVTTAVGAAIGAFAGGAGAAPGAAAGLEVGMALLEWIGLGFLVAWLGQSVVRIGAAFSAFFSAVWHARGDQQAIDRAARAFAEALGTLAATLLEALVMWATAAGVRAAIGKLQGTRLGQQFGESRLGQWLEQRVHDHRSGRSPLPGPREALRRLLKRRRRGEQGDEQGPKPPQPADAWSELAERHGLDEVVTEILRLDQVDPAVADRLLAGGMNQFDLGELALQHGADGVRAADAMAQANVPLNAARHVLQIGRDVGLERQLIDLVNSGRLENLPGLRRFMRDIAVELSDGQLGKYNQLMEACERVMHGDRVSLEGRRQTPHDAESGQADVVDYTRRQAVQMKTVTSESELGVIQNLQSAINQLGGVTGEHPPQGFQRIADIRIAGGKNPLRSASRAQLLAALRGKLNNLYHLTPAGATLGIIRIMNAISTFVFTCDELR